MLENRKENLECVPWQLVFHIREAIGNVDFIFFHITVIVVVAV